MTRRIQRGRNTDTGEIIEVDIPTWEVEVQMEVRAKSRAGLFAALSYFLQEQRTLPSWLAQAVCSDWGRSVMTNVTKEAEAVVKPSSRN